MSPFKKKKPSDRPQSEVWKHFEKKPLKSASHFSAKCNYCKTFWACGHLQQLEEHLANNCKECPELVYAFYLGVVSSRDFGSEDASIPSPENNKKRKIQVEQRELTDWFESAKITSQKEASITRALVCAFTCCGISFSIIENPFFIEFLHEMRPGYVPPSCELLSGRFLNQEMARINKKVKKIIEDSENLTLGHDMAKQTIKSCNRIISFFKQSHIVGKLLADAATTLQIEGGGLKTYSETRTRIKNRILENYNHYCSAGQIWRNNGGDKKLCNRLLAQIRNYELRRSPYNQDFDNSLETPMKEDDKVDNRIRSPTLEIPNHEVRVLIIENYFDLKDTVKGLNNNDKNSDDSDVESDSDSDVGSDIDSENLNDSANNNSENETESDYDVEELVQQHLLDDDLIGNTL
ncbi:unnamed protein product [Rhizophagus irregularis]|uniref:BED-type domain-containing protein n=1 Tax=Rhizophagus irregularis TaxID=588596 RepID=A0A915Z827_9GLOM|nr:unnamed protein product [Rhizophagus irregularis]